MKEQTEQYGKRLFEQTAELLGTNQFHIAGGVLRAYVEDFHLVSSFNSNTPILSKDVDCFFNDGAEYFKAKESLEARGYVVGRERTSSVSMDKDGHTSYDLVYLAKIFNGSDIIDDFDFTNCCIAIGKEGLLLHHDNFFIDVAARNLKINKVKIPYHTISRAGKFMKNGYTLDNESKVLLFDNAANASYGPYEEDEYTEAAQAAPNNIEDLGLGGDF